MKNRKAFIAFVFGLLIAGLVGPVQAGDWEQAPISDLDGLLNARTDLKKPTMMELGRKGGTSGHPDAYGEIEVRCAGRLAAGDRHCNIQLDIAFSKPKGRERIKIQVFNGDSEPAKTVYLFQSTSTNTMARLYVVGVRCKKNVNPTVRVSIRGDGEPVRGNARVTFMNAVCEKEDKTNWQVASNYPLYGEDGKRLDRPTFLFQGN
jgi:hypothetical protein